jgi:hypothetical protein
MSLASNYIGVKPNAGDDVVELKTGLIGTIIREYMINFYVPGIQNNVKWHRYVIDFSGDRKKLSKTKLYKLGIADLAETETLVSIA